MSNQNIKPNSLFYFVSEGSVFAYVSVYKSGAHVGFLETRGPNFEMGANVQATRYKLQILYTSKKKRA